MAGLSLTEIVKHAITQLDDAHAVLKRHQASDYGLCRCLRPLPCSAAEAARLWANHWQARLDYFQPKLAAINPPTVALPTLRAAAPAWRRP